MEQPTTEQKNNETAELKTLEDVDKNAQNNTSKINSETEQKAVATIEELTKQLSDKTAECELYKNKYTKAVEVNGQLYQRLTSAQKPQEPSALENLLNKY